jgi:hypothetical protein
MMDSGNGHNHDDYGGGGNFGVHIHVLLLGGNEVTVDGQGLFIEEVNEVFEMLQGKLISGHKVERTVIGDE